MKKLIVGIVLIALLGGGLWYVKTHKSVKTVSVTSSYKNTETGISFTYPKTLTVTNTNIENNAVLLHHEVPFEHRDYCDFKGDATSTLQTLTDFNVQLHTDDQSLVLAMQTESPYIPKENFLDGHVIPSPGFIDSVTIGNYSGYKIFEGAEGCGQTIYFLSISNIKTLVVTDDLITVFTGAIDASQSASALAVPGVISNQTHDQIFNALIKTISVN